MPRARTPQRCAAAGSRGYRQRLSRPRKHPALPPSAGAQTAAPGGAVAATSSTSQADTDCAGKRHRAGSRAQAGDATEAEAAISDPVAKKLAEWIILRSDDNGASVERYRAFITANPSWPSQTFLRRRVEAALWDDHRDDATVLAWFENESPISAKGKLRAGAGDARARRPGQCRATGARRLAQRLDVGGHREHRARPVRRLVDARRSKGADGSVSLWQRARGRAAGRQAAGRRSGRVGEGAHRGLSQGVQHQGPARCGSARAAQRSRLHLQQDPAASPRREVRRSRPAHARARRGIPAGCTISTNGGSNGDCWRARCSTSASTAPPI